MTITMQGFAKITPDEDCDRHQVVELNPWNVWLTQSHLECCVDWVEPPPAVWFSEDFTATTSGSIGDQNASVDEAGTGWSALSGTWPYQGDGSGIRPEGTSFNDYAAFDTVGRVDAVLTVDAVFGRGTTDQKWTGFILRSTDGAPANGLYVRGFGPDSGSFDLDLKDDSTTLKTWDLSALMAAPPENGDRLRIVMIADGDDITLVSIAVNGAAAEVINDTYTLTSTAAAAHGAAAGATVPFYGILTNEQATSTPERFRFIELAAIPVTPVVLPPLVPRFRSSTIVGCLGCEFRPVIPKCLPSDPVHANQGGGYFGWWFDPTLPEMSGEAYGFVFHDFTLTDPRALSASRTEALRQRLTLHDGLLLGEMIVEVFAADLRSSKWLAARVKDELESMTLCCPASMDVYADCVTKDGISGLRRLRGVGEFHVTELAETAPMAPTSTMLSIVFAAATLVEVPDGIVGGAATVLGEADLGPCEEPVTSTLSYLPKTVLTVDLELIDGALRVCPVDIELGSYNSVTHYMSVRELRADPPVPCPIEVALDLTASTPVVNAYQPTLWAEQLARIGSGDDIDCQNHPIVVRSVRIINPDYNPDCLTCPPGIRAAGCADGAGIVYDGDGIIDWAGSGISASTWYEVAAAGTPSATMQKILDYWRCLKVRGESASGSGLVPNQELWNFDAVIASWAGPGTVTHYRVKIDELGAPQVQLEGSAGGGPINVSAQVAVDGNSFPGYSATDIIYTDELIEDCIEGPPECFPIVEGPPSQAGPCVTVTVNAAGVASMPLDPTVDDLSSARFEFAPCADTDCPGVIPVDAPVTVAGDVATPVGWSPGWLWPSDSEGSQYEILSVGGAANLVDPLEILVFSGGSYEPKPQDVWRSHLTGLSPLLHYRPDWSIVADSPADNIWVALWVGGPGDTPPDESTMQAELLCSGTALSVLIVAGPLAAGDTVEAGAYGLRFTPVGVSSSVDAFGAGVVSAAEMWSAPEVFGATQAALFVFYVTELEETAPTVEFQLVPEVTP